MQSLALFAFSSRLAHFPASKDRVCGSRAWSFLGMPGIVDPAGPAVHLAISRTGLICLPFRLTATDRWIVISDLNTRPTDALERNLALGLTWVGAGVVRYAD
ncbi:MAG TPA: hypothetical protein VGS58_02390 [Candidatus Sulfopaludibacter sp.]|nr:hypothetical protein [Candidatus Sulfopaludibacter sp.]